MGVVGNKKLQEVITYQNSICKKNIGMGVDGNINRREVIIYQNISFSLPSSAFRSTGLYSNYLQVGKSAANSCKKRKQYIHNFTESIKYNTGCTKNMQHCDFQLKTIPEVRFYF